MPRLLISREDAVREQRNARHCLKALPHAAQQTAFQEHLHAVSESGARIARLEQSLRDALSGWSLAPAVAALQGLRGVQLLAAITLVVEIQDFHRFGRIRAFRLPLTPSQLKRCGRRCLMEPL